MQAQAQAQDFISVADPAPIANIQAEEAFLGAALLDPVVSPQHLDISPEVFYLEDHKKIWEAMLMVAKKGKFPDLMMTLGVLIDAKHEGFQSKLAYLLEHCISSFNHAEYMALIVDKYQRRQAQQFRYRLNSIASNTEDTLWKEKAQIEFGQLWDTGSKSRGFEHASKFFDKATSPVDSIATGINSIDEAWGGGFAQGNLITIAGRPGMGKSAFACWLSLTLAHRGESVAFASVEMRAEEVLQRWMGILLDVPYQSIRARGCNGDPKIEKARHYVEQLPLFIDDETSTAEGITAKTIALFQQTKLGLLVIDHLHRIFPGSDPATVDAANKAVTGFKNLAKKLNIPVVLLCQLNRGVEGRENKRPMASDVRQFGNIEQESDLMIGLYRDEFYNEHSSDRNTTEIITMKNRHGSCRKIKVASDVARCLYSEMPEAGGSDEF